MSVVSNTIGEGGLSSLLKSHFEKFTGMFMERMTALESRIEEKDNIIKSLVLEMSQMKCDYSERLTAVEARLGEKDRCIDTLSEDLSQMKQQLFFATRENERLALEMDDLQQYGRRMNVRIDGIPYESDESESDLQGKIIDTLKPLGVDVDPGMLVRFHRSAAPYKNKDGVVVAQCIMRFASWRPRKQAHAAKKIAMKKKIPIYISHDRTKSRYDLFKSAARRLKEVNIKDTFAFVDVNSNLVVRSNDNLRYFNTTDDLNDILLNL